MQIKTWQLGSSSADNAANLAAIKEWWASLAGQDVTWRQRMIPQNGSVQNLNWESQRFDEVFQMQSPDIRGITLYFRKPDAPAERSTTPAKLELDSLRQQLYIFPQSQKELVIQVGLPRVVYQTVAIKNPQWEGGQAGGDRVLTLRDDIQKLEIKVTLSPENLLQLKQALE